MKTVMALYDLQYPHHESKVVSIAFQLAKDYRPDIFILGGDNLNCTSLASHGPTSQERVEQPIWNDYKNFDRDILQRIESLPSVKGKILLEGNHEMWIYDYMERHPELRGSLDYIKLLDLKNRGWEVVRYKKYKKLGKLYFHHGDWRISRKRFTTAKYYAARAVQMVGRNIRFGHQHTYQVHSEVSPLSSDDAHTAMCIPAACKLDQRYLEGGDTNWLNGLYIGWIHDDGNFSDYTIVVTKGKATFAGKTYIG